MSTPSREDHAFHFGGLQSPSSSKSSAPRHPRSEQRLSTGYPTRRDPATTAPVTAKTAVPPAPGRRSSNSTSAATHRAQEVSSRQASATRTGCRAGDQQQEHRHYDADRELTQRAANPARADNGARRDQQQTKIATEAGMLISKHRIQRNAHTHQ